jgi:hypothetical protein
MQACQAAWGRRDEEETRACEALRRLARDADAAVGGGGNFAGGDDDGDDDDDDNDDDDYDYDADESEDEEAPENSSTKRCQNRRKYKPPKGSPLALHLDNRKQLIMRTDAGITALEKGRQWFPPLCDPVSCQGKKPTDWYQHSHDAPRHASRNIPCAILSCLPVSSYPSMMPISDT